MCNGAFEGLCFTKRLRVCSKQIGASQIANECVINRAISVLGYAFDSGESRLVLRDCVKTNKFYAKLWPML